MKAKFIYLFVAMVLPMTTLAGTLEQAAQIDCSSNKDDHYLRLVRATSVLEGKFAGLPKMTNWIDGEAMPIEVQHDGGQTYLLALTRDARLKIVGSIAVVTPTGKNLQSKEILPIVFTDMAGTVKTENLNCTLAF